MKKQIFLVIMLVLMVGISILSTGCAATGLTKEDVHRRHVDTINIQKLQFQDAVDAWLMLDRPPRTSSLYVR